MVNLPEEFVKTTRNALGRERYARLEAALQEDATVSVRLNSGKCDTAKTVVNDCSGSVGWCPSGTYLGCKPDFTFDPLMHGGLYYVQEASSMFIDFVLRQLVAEPVVMLDLCAAPGGKTTACRAALPAGSLLIANETVRTRASILAENVQKWGHPDVIVTNNAPQDFPHAGILYDVILADVPCSGEGMFRKDEAARAEWSSKNVENCQRLQRRIIAGVWQSLREGGLFIYSTCTFNTLENEENAAWIAAELGAEFISLPIKSEWNIQSAVVGNNPVYRFLPGYTRGEGLFVTVFRKTSKATSLEQKRIKTNRQNPTFSAKELPLKNAADFTTRQKGDRLLAIPTWWADKYDIVSQQLNIIHAGITVGTMRGGGSLPAQSLALSVCLDRSRFAICNIDRVQAISYLRREAIVLPPETPRGIVLLTYRDLPIGFAKNIGSRANNLYPQDWKIRTTHISEHENEIIAHYETIS